MNDDIKQIKHIVAVVAQAVADMIFVQTCSNRVRCIGQYENLAEKYKDLVKLIDSLQDDPATYTPQTTTWGLPQEKD
jgi:hypothetical protein